MAGDLYIASGTEKRRINIGLFNAMKEQILQESRGRFGMEKPWQQTGKRLCRRNGRVTGALTVPSKMIWRALSLLQNTSLCGCP